MTHPPTLPNGFSTDFSETPDAFYAYAEIIPGHILGGEARMTSWGRAVWAGSGVLIAKPLCWCPIPTPGDAVLKELAEGK